MRWIPWCQASVAESFEEKTPKQLLLHGGVRERTEGDIGAMGVGEFAARVAGERV